MRHGIIGCGFISDTHADAIKRLGGTIVGGYDPVRERADKFGYMPVGDLIDKSDVVHICTPVLFHKPYLEMCKDKVVFVEKPIIMPGETCDFPEKTVVCYQRRFNKQCLTIKEMQPENVGAQVFVRRDPHYWSSWRGEKEYSGGGVLANIGIHYIDLLYWWFGDLKVESVTAGYFDNKPYEETMTVVLSSGKKTAKVVLNARHHERDIYMMAFNKHKIVVYKDDDAGHYELFKAYLEDGVGVGPEEALASLRIVDDIYKHINANRAA